VDRILTIPNANQRRPAGRGAGLPVAGARAADRDRRLLGRRPAHRGRPVRLAGRQDRPRVQPGSRLGEVLDPAADRLYIAATSIALGIRASSRGDDRCPGAARADGRRRPWPCCDGGPGSAPCRSASSARPPRFACFMLSPCSSLAITPAGEGRSPGVLGWASRPGEPPCTGGRDAVPGPGQEPRQRHREFVRPPRRVLDSARDGVHIMAETRKEPQSH